MASMVMAVCTTFSFEDLSCQLCGVCVCVCTATLNLCMYNTCIIEPDSPLTQYITNAGISRARYTIMLFKHNHCVLWLISK